MPWCRGRGIEVTRSRAYKKKLKFVRNFGFLNDLAAPTDDANALASWLDKEIREERKKAELLELEANLLRGWSKYIERSGIDEGVVSPSI